VARRPVPRVSRAARARLGVGPIGPVVLIVLLVVTGCSGGTRSNGPGAGTGPVTTSASGAQYEATAPDAEPSDATDTPRAGTPDAVAIAATTAWFSWDTRIDHRPNDTVRRLALDRLAPALRRQVLTFTSDADPGAQWAGWSARHATATVSAAIGGDDRPPDDPAQAWRQVDATIALHGDGGWTDDVGRTVFVRLERVAGHWLVTDLSAAAPA